MDHTFTHSQPNIELKPTKAHNPLPNLTLIHSPRLSREQPRAASASPPPLSLSLSSSPILRRRQPASGAPRLLAAAYWSSDASRHGVAPAAKLRRTAQRRPPAARLSGRRTVRWRRRPCGQDPADGGRSASSSSASRPVSRGRRPICA